MLDSGLLIGAPRLRILGTDKSSTILQLNLPYPNKDGGVVVSDVWAKAIKTQLLNGAVRFIPGGIRHNVAITWDLYDPVYTGHPIGITDGDTPELGPLYNLLATYNTGRLAISPCSNLEIWYRVACTSDMNRQTIYPAGFGSITLNFEGLDLFADSTSTTPVG